MEACFPILFLRSCYEYATARDSRQEPTVISMTKSRTRWREDFFKVSLQLRRKNERQERIHVPQLPFARMHFSRKCTRATYITTNISVFRRRTGSSRWCPWRTILPRKCKNALYDVSSVFFKENKKIFQDDKPETIFTSIWRW